MQGSFQHGRSSQLALAQLGILVEVLTISHVYEHISNNNLKGEMIRCRLWDDNASAPCHVGQHFATQGYKYCIQNKKECLRFACRNIMNFI